MSAPTKIARIRILIHGFPPLDAGSGFDTLVSARVPLAAFPGLADPDLADPGLADRGLADPGFADSGFAPFGFGPCADFGGAFAIYAPCKPKIR